MEDHHGVLSGNAQFPTQRESRERLLRAVTSPETGQARTTGRLDAQEGANQPHLTQSAENSFLDLLRAALDGETDLPDPSFGQGLLQRIEATVVLLPGWQQEIVVMKNELADTANMVKRCHLLCDSLWIALAQRLARRQTVQRRDATIGATTDTTSAAEDKCRGHASQ
ncbi:MAG: hypothetical protein MUF54_24895 [Polyangiaceae bacterium]|nr:hypothetical protein [Polyangiaceae bacterium]